MKNYLLLLGGSLLLAGTAQAQSTFSVGPRIGLNLATAHFSDDAQSAYTSRPGFEAGLTGSVQLSHFALQPSLLFSQKGYHSAGRLPSFDTPVTYEEDVRLNYLTLPLNMAFSLRHDGQGLHVFAGPYASLLLGGNFIQHAYISSSIWGPSSEKETTGKVQAASVVSDANKLYSRRFDGGLQAGVGYRLKGVQLQANYSLGLRNLAVQYQGYSGQVSDGAAYYNRSWQLSLSYLVGPKS